MSETKAVGSHSLFKWGDDGEKSRVTLFPIKYPEIYEYRNVYTASRWLAKEIDMTRDRESRSRMSPETIHMVKHCLAVFSTLDDKVLSILEWVEKKLDCKEAQSALAGQKDGEAEHIESYNRQVEAFAMDSKERDEIFSMVSSSEEVKALVEWVNPWMEGGEHSFEECYLAFACVEGVLFSGQFCMLQYLRELNLTPGIADSNGFILRDEGSHCDFACLLIKKYLVKRPSAEAARKIIKGAVSVAEDFIRAAIPKPIRDISADGVIQYVKFQADVVANNAGYKSVYGVTQPYKFMDKVSLNKVGKFNFFERRPTQYRGAPEGGKVWGIDDSEIIV